MIHNKTVMMRPPAVLSSSLLSRASKFQWIEPREFRKNLQCFYFVTISIFFPDPFPHLFSQPVSFAHIDFVSFCFAILSVANIFYQALLTLHFYLRLVFKIAFSASYVIFSSSFCNFFNFRSPNTVFLLVVGFMNVIFSSSFCNFSNFCPI